MTAKLSGSPYKRTTRAGVDYYVQNYYDGNGKRPQGTGPTPRAAIADAKQRMAGTHTKPVKASDTISFERLTEKFLTAVSTTGRNGKLPHTYYSVDIYRSYLRTWIIPRLGAMRVTSLTRHDLTTFRDEVVAETTSRTTATKALTITKSILSYAVEQGIIAVSPAQKVSVTSDWSEDADRKESRTPTIRDMRKLEETAKACYESEDLGIYRAYRRYYPYFLILRTLGLRSCEAIGLRWGDFDDSMSMVNIRRTIAPPKRGMAQEDRIQRTKTKNGRRTIPVPPEIVPVLRQWQKECLKTEHDWMFPTKSGRPVSYDNMKTKFWDPLIRRAGLEGKGYGMHGMRHFYASTLIRKSRAKEAQMYLGHHSVAFTMDQYGHLFPDDKTTMDEVRSTVIDGMDV